MTARFVMGDGKDYVARPSNQCNDRTIAHCKQALTFFDNNYISPWEKKGKWQDPNQTTIWFNNCPNHQNNPKDTTDGCPFRGLITDREGLQGVPHEDGDGSRDWLKKAKDAHAPEIGQDDTDFEGDADAKPNEII